MVNSMSPRNRQKIRLAKIADKTTKSIGSVPSLVIHTIIFAICFILPFLGISTDKMLLVLTTFLSIEAIYLAILIQMTVNKNTADLEVIQEDVEEIQEDIEEIEKDVDEIQEDIEEIEDEQDKEIEKDRKEQEYEVSLLTNIQSTLKELQKEIENLKNK